MRSSLRRRSIRVVVASAVLAATVESAVLLPNPASAAGVAVGSSSSGSSTSRTSISLGRPAGTQAGQVMVASVAINDDDPVTAPAGWSLIRQDTILDTLRQNLYFKVATASEPGSYTWTLPDWRRVAGGITTYAGVDPAAPINASGSQTATVATTAVTAPSITTTVADTLLVHFAAVSAEGSLTPPAGMAERWEVASPNGSNTRDALASLSDGVQAAAEATGARTATATQAGRNIGALIALRPAG